MIRIELICTGEELLTGHTINTNQSDISTLLSHYGLHIKRVHTVGDQLEEIESVIKDVLSRADICLMTGGLGPTKDDNTIEALAKAMKVELVENKERDAHIKDFFKKRGKKAPFSNKKQALAPVSSQQLSNPIGTAMGIHCQHQSKMVLCLPGVPRECLKMMKEQVVPLFKSKIPSLNGRCIKIFKSELGESEIADRLRALYPLSNQCGIAYKPTLSDVEITLSAPKSEEISFNNLVAEVKVRIEGSILAEDNETFIGNLIRKLEEKSSTVSVAESCTGGLIGHLITSEPGASRVFLEGVICYSNTSKNKRLNIPMDIISQYGAVSDKVAHYLAETIRDQSGSTFSLAVTGVAGPDGGSKDKPVGTIYAALGTPNGVEVFDFFLAGERRTIQLRTAYKVLRKLYKAIQ